MFFRRTLAEVAQTRAQISAAATDGRIAVHDAKETVELLATMVVVVGVIACVALVLAIEP